MFLLVGVRPTVAVMFAVTFVCGHCGTAALQRIVRQQQKVTPFFVPLLSIGTSWFVECDHCARATSLTKEQARHSLAWADSHEHAVA